MDFKGFSVCHTIFLGVAGFLLSGEALLDSAFITLCMYGMGYPDPIPNLLVEIARWTAPLAAVGGILLLFQVNRRLKNWVRSFHKTVLRYMERTGRMCF